MKTLTLLVVLLFPLMHCHAQLVSGHHQSSSARQDSVGVSRGLHVHVDSLKNQEGPNAQFHIYLNSKGREIYRIEGRASEQVFVVRTFKTTQQLYSGGTRDGHSNPISRKVARQTERLLSRGKLEGDHMQNLIPIVNRTEQQKILDHAMQDGKGTGRHLSAARLDNFKLKIQYFKERTGDINQNGQYIAGPDSPPGIPGQHVKEIHAGGFHDVHTHPEGTFTDANGNKWAYTQPPSNRDILSSDCTQYVLGMTSRKVYVYDSTGVLAIIPFKRFGR